MSWDSCSQPRSCSSRGFYLERVPLKHKLGTNVERAPKETGSGSKREATEFCQAIAQSTERDSFDKQAATSYYILKIHVQGPPND